MSGRAGDISVKPPGYKTAVPLRLIRGEDGQALWEKRSHSMIPASAPEGAATPENYPPEIRIHYTLRGSDLGVGQKRYVDRSRRAGFSQGVNTLFEESWFCGPAPQYHTALTGPGRDFAQLGGELYVGSSIYVYMLNRSTGVFDLKDTGPAEITGLVMCNATLYKAHGASTKWESSTDGTTWTENSASGDDRYANRFAVTYTDTGKPQLWKALAPNKLGVTTDPTSKWTLYVIGDSDANIVDLRVVENVLVIIKEDGLWILEANGRARNIAQSWRHHRHSRQGFGANSEHQQLLVPVGKNGLVEIDQGTGVVSTISPSRTMSDYPQYMGPIDCVISDGDYWYAFVEDATASPAKQTQVLVAKRIGLQGSAVYPWSHLATLSLGRVDAAWVANLAGLGPRLYFSGRAESVADGSAASLLSNKIGYLTLSDRGNPRFASTYSFADGVTIRSGILNRFPGWETAFQEVRLRTSDKGGEALGGGGRSIIVRYNAFDGRGFREVGGSALGQTYTSPVDTLYFRTTKEAGVTAEQLEIELDLRHDGSSSTPVVEELHVMGTVRPNAVTIFRFTVYAADNVEGPGGQSNVSGTRIGKALDSMLTPGWSTLLTDRAGNTHEVYLVSEGGLVERDVLAYADGQGKAPVRVRAYELTVFEVPNSDQWSREEIVASLAPDPITLTVTTAGTQQRFTTTSSAVRALLFRSRKGNTGVVYIGDSGVGVTDGLELSPGESFPISVTDEEASLDPSDWWGDVAVSGEIIDMMRLA